MKKKSLFFALVTCLFLNLVFNNPISSYAAVTNFDTKNANKLTGLVRGIGEKMGISWTGSTLAAVVGWIGGQNSNNAISFIGELPVMDGQIDMSNQNYTDYLLSPDDFKLGVDTIQEAIDTALPGTTFPVYGKCISSPVSQAPLVPYILAQDSRYWYYITISSGGFTYKANTTGPGEQFTAVGPTSFQTSQQLKYSYPSPNFSGSRTQTLSGNYTDGSSFSIVPDSGTVTIAYDSQINVCNYTFTNTDVPDTSNVSDNWSTPSAVNYNYYTNYTIITNPTDPTSGIDQPLNQSLQNSDPIFTPQEPTDQPAGSSWWKWLFKPLFDFLSGITDLFTKIFVPDSQSISDQFSGLSDSFKAKIPVSGQLSDFWGGLKGAVVHNDKVPTFNMSFPPEWGGGSYPIIDFSYFTDYRTWILNFIRFSAWFVFLKRLYGRIASLI
jgi:hypothetical protein